MKNRIVKIARTTFIISFLLITNNVFAQASLAWGNYYGGAHRDAFQGMAKDSLDNIFVAGTFMDNVNFDPAGTNPLTNSGNAKVFIVKYNADGNHIWSKSLGLGLPTNHPFKGAINVSSIATDTSGNILIEGIFSGTVDFNPNGVDGSLTNSGPVDDYSATMDIFVLKLSKDGDFMWVKQIGKSQYSEVASGIRVDRENNVYVAGLYGNINGPYLSGNGLDFVIGNELQSLQGYGTFVLKMNDAGDYLWVKGITNGVPPIISVYSHSDRSTTESLEIDPLGNIFIGVTSYSTEEDVIYDKNGSSQHVETAPANLSWMSLVFKLDTDGNYNWSTRVEGIDFAKSSASSLNVDKNGNVYFAGNFFNSVNVIGKNTSMTLPTADNMYSNAVYGSAFLIKVDGQGNLTWVKNFSPINENNTSAIGISNLIVNDFGDIYLSGVYYKGGTTDFDPSSNQYTTPLTLNNQLSPMFLLKLNSSGIFQWVEDIGYNENTLKSQLLFSISQCEIYLGSTIGTWSGSNSNTPDPHTNEPRDYDPDPTKEKMITTHGYTDIYLSKFITDFKPHITPLSSLAFCVGDSVVLDAGNGYTSYQWSPTNETTRMITVNTSGKYFVTATKTCGTGISDTVTTKVAPNPTVIITGDSSICEGKTTTLKAEGGKFYSWNSGSTHDTTMVAPIGKTMYTVTVTDTIGCVSNDSVEVKVNKLPIASIGSNQTICSNDSISLTGTGGTTALWSNGGTSHTITVSPQEETTYIFTALNGGCADTASVTVFVLQAPEVTLTPDIGFTMPQGSEAVLTATGEGNYVWTPSEGLSCSTCPNPTVTPIQHTTYCVTVTNEANCKTTKCIPIKVECGELFVPNSFSPNGDKINDVLEVRLNPGCISEYEFSIYDRWGEKLFSSTKITDTWDGTFDGKELDNAVFVYTLKIKLVDSSEFIYKKGNVSIIR